MLDLGANIGIFSRWVKTHYPEAKILGVEPEAGNLSILHKNVESENLATSAIYVQACVAGTVRSVVLDRSKSEWGYKMLDAPHSDAETIPTVTIADLLSLGEIDTDIDMMKCDVEGAENEIFQNCAPWIRKVRTLIIETHPPYTPEALIEDIARNGGNLILKQRYEIGWGLFVLLFQRVS